MIRSAYDFGELDKAVQEGRRLSLQALAFVEMELPHVIDVFSERKAILDYGCGQGLISAALARRLPAAKITGVDPDKTVLLQAQSLNEKESNLEFAELNDQWFKSHKGSYDVVFARLVLMHLPSPKDRLMELASLLVDGGILYLVEGDEGHVQMEPSEPWQRELLGHMAAAQELRGGNRRMGSKLLGLLQDAKYSLEGGRTFFYSTDDLGRERWKGIFTPALGGMAERDLKYLVEYGKLDIKEVEKLLESVKNFVARDDFQARISAWHAWAKKTKAGI